MKTSMERKPMDKQLVHLDNWSVVTDDRGPYAAPETITSRLSGTASGHPMHEDGHEIVSSSIISAKGRKVETKNTIYSLGMRHPDYKDWMNANNIDFDPMRPVKTNGYTKPYHKQKDPMY